MMNYGLGNMMMGGSAADGAPGMGRTLMPKSVAQPQANPLPQDGMFAGLPQKPGIAQMLLSGRAPGPLPAYVPPAPPKKKRPSWLDIAFNPAALLGPQHDLGVWLGIDNDPYQGLPIGS
jgi:hypothetical protein